MKFLLFFSLTLSLLVILSTAHAQQPETSSNNPEVQPYIHEGELFPPMLLMANFGLDEFEEKLNNYRAFESVTTDAPGKPLRLRIVRGVIEKNDAAKATSVLLAASTLGLVPVVSNNVFRVRYDLFVRNESVAHFEYDLPMTDVSSFWSGNKKSKTLNEEQEAFFDQSIDKFLIELSNSDVSKKYFEEYFYYFQ